MLRDSAYKPLINIVSILKVYTKNPWQWYCQKVTSSFGNQLVDLPPYPTNFRIVQPAKCPQRRVFFWSRRCSTNSNAPFVWICSRWLSLQRLFVPKQIIPKLLRVWGMPASILWRLYHSCIETREQGMPNLQKEARLQKVPQTGQQLRRSHSGCKFSLIFPRLKWSFFAIFFKIIILTIWNQTSQNLTRRENSASSRERKRRHALFLSVTHFYGPNFEKFVWNRIFIDFSDFPWSTNVRQNRQLNNWSDERMGEEFANRGRTGR